MVCPCCMAPWPALLLVCVIGGRVLSCDMARARRYLVMFWTRPLFPNCFCPLTPRPVSSSRWLDGGVSVGADRKQSNRATPTITRLYPGQPKPRAVASPGIVITLIARRASLVPSTPVLTMTSFSRGLPLLPQRGPQAPAGRCILLIDREELDCTGDLQAHGKPQWFRAATPHHTQLGGAAANTPSKPSAPRYDRPFPAERLSAWVHKRNAQPSTSPTPGRLTAARLSSWPRTSRTDQPPVASLSPAMHCPTRSHREHTAR